MKGTNFRVNCDQASASCFTWSNVISDHIGEVSSEEDTLHLSLQTQIFRHSLPLWLHDPVLIHSSHLALLSHSNLPGEHSGSSTLLARMFQMDAVKAARYKAFLPSTLLGKLLLAPLGSAGSHHCSLWSRAGQLISQAQAVEQSTAQISQWEKEAPWEQEELPRQQ